MSEVKLIKRTIPTTEEDSRRKAEFDSSMVMIRYNVRFASAEAAEYFFREMMAQVRLLSSRHGFKIG